MQYQFRVGYADAAGWHWTALTNGYTTTASCTWTPTTANAYTLVVWARQLGHTANYDQYATQVYQVNAPKLTAVSAQRQPAFSAKPRHADYVLRHPHGDRGAGGISYRVGTLGATSAASGRRSIPGTPRVPAMSGCRASPARTPWSCGRASLGIPTTADQYATLTYQITDGP